MTGVYNRLPVTGSGVLEIHLRGAWTWVAFLSENVFYGRARLLLSRKLLENPAQQELRPSK